MNKVVRTNDEYDEVLQLIATKVGKLKNDQIELFFRAFLTPSEILELCDRFLIVRGLVSGQSQRQIAQELGVSISKVTAGSRELKFSHGKSIFDEFINL